MKVNGRLQQETVCLVTDQRVPVTPVAPMPAPARTEAHSLRLGIKGEVRYYLGGYGRFSRQHFHIPLPIGCNLAAKLIDLQKYRATVLHEYRAGFCRVQTAVIAQEKLRPKTQLEIGEAVARI